VKESFDGAQGLARLHGSNVYLNHHRRATIELFLAKRRRSSATGMISSPSMADRSNFWQEPKHLNKAASLPALNAQDLGCAKSLLCEIA
jgi:hypothetical protein